MSTLSLIEPSKLTLNETINNRLNEINEKHISTPMGSSPRSSPRSPYSKINIKTRIMCNVLPKSEIVYIQNIEYDEYVDINTYKIQDKIPEKHNKNNIFFSCIKGI